MILLDQVVEIFTHPCAARTCSGVILRPSRHAAVKVSSPK
jgi:hypothetical protein